MHLTAILPDLNLVPQSFLFVVVGALGAIIGSFLNVVIHRLPREESIVLPSSRCPACGGGIAFYDNVPVLSYLMLGGRCRSCKTHISARYPAVEALTAALWLLVFWRVGLTWALPFDLIFVTAVTALVFIDAEHMILPNAITYPGVAFALIARVAVPWLMGQPHFDDVLGVQQMLGMGWSNPAASLVGAIIGALVGGGSLFLMGEAWTRLRHVEAMGLGDVKMMLMVGAYLGWRLTILNIFLGALTGSIIGIGVTLYQGRRDLQGQLPFGVYLGIGAIIALVFGTQIVNWYAGFYR